MSSFSLYSISQINFSQIVSDGKKWVFENNQNLLETNLPIITLIATQTLRDSSLVFSALWAGVSFIGVKVYYNNQKEDEVKQVNEKKESETRAAEAKKEIVSLKIQLLISYLYLNLEEMQKVFMGYEVGGKGEKLKEGEYSEKQERFIKACKTLRLSSEAVQNIWVTYPNKGDVGLRDALLCNLIPTEMKAYLTKELKLDLS
ncbi:MAG: hypothetical protein K1060chlam1_01140 [Candidatus Anoxychlamydiales bacterium]|nr:hypothetical protein [Candidatus Anoxychlamydiales bacterium]